MTNVICQGNLAAKGGGMFIDGNYHPVLANPIFRGNYASYYGGGLYTDTGISGELTLTKVSVNRNVAGIGGGGVWSNYSQPVLENCIVWGNRAGSSGDQILSNIGQSTLGHSIVQGSGGSGAGRDETLGTDGGGNLDTDPLLLVPVDPDIAPTAGGDLRLGAGSPAINAGDNSLLPEGLTTDLSGWPRIYDGRVDMGAYEAHPRFPVYLPVITKSTQQ